MVAGPRSPPRANPNSVTKYSAMAESGTSSLAGRVAFTYPGFALFLTARWFIIASLEMHSVAVGWQIYQITRSPLALGLVGLAQFLPGILLFLVSGHTADRFSRRKILFGCYAGFAVCSTFLFLISVRGVPSVYWIYGVMVMLGIVRAFNGPATRAIVPQMVPEEHLPNAVAWGSTTFQSATILGPSIGGVIYALANGPLAVYATSMTLSAAAMFSMLGVNPVSKPRPREPVSLKTVLAGLHYIWRKKIILGSISLDLFAVLLGAEPSHCFLCMRTKSCTQVHGGSAFCDARRESAQAPWRFFWPTVPFSEKQAGRCSFVSLDSASSQSSSESPTISIFRWRRSSWLAPAIW